MQIKPLVFAVASTFAPDHRYGANGGCPHCAIMFGHIEGCPSPNAGMSSLPVWPRMKRHEFHPDTRKCERCTMSAEWVHNWEVRPIYGDKKILECVALERKNVIGSVSGAGIFGAQGA